MGTRMIICPWFSGDTNRALQKVQHDLYPFVVGLLFDRPRKRYLRSAQLLGVHTFFAQKVAPITRFDHRVLQRAHDIVAADYRFFWDDGGQVPLPLARRERYEDLLERRWKEFYTQEVTNLTEDDSIVVAVLTAVAFQNKDTGYDAEDRLQELLEARYSSVATAKAHLMQGNASVGGAGRVSNAPSQDA
jgi:hypothetical protein